MNVELSPKLLDVVEVSNEYLGLEATGVARGTVLEVFGEPPGQLLVEIADESGVPSDLVTVPITKVKTVWSSRGSEDEKSSTNDARSHYESGIFLLQNGLLAEARTQLKAAFELDPGLAGALMNSANDLAQREMYEPAIIVYQLILDLQPENRLSKQNLAATHINRGVLYARNGAVDKAVEEFGYALALGLPKEFTERAQHNLVAAYTQLGMRFSEINRYQDALSHFFMALQIMPSDITRRNFAIALVSLQASRRTEGKHPLSILAFRQPMQMGLTFSECLNAYGATIASLGDIESARRALEEAVHADPENERIRKNLERLKTAQESTGPRQMNFGITAIEPQPMTAR